MKNLSDIINENIYESVKPLNNKTFKDDLVELCELVSGDNNEHNKAIKVEQNIYRAFSELTPADIKKIKGWEKKSDGELEDYVLFISCMWDMLEMEILDKCDGEDAETVQKYIDKLDEPIDLKNFIEAYYRGLNSTQDKAVAQKYAKDVVNHFDDICKLMFGKPWK